MGGKKEKFYSKQERSASFSDVVIKTNDGVVWVVPSSEPRVVCRLNSSGREGIITEMLPEK